MALWFFFKGPKPVFDRWTYWEKFPMDFVIFNGRLSKHEMLEENGEQWKG
jgi:hypothetical protein